MIGGLQLHPTYTGRTGLVESIEKASDSAGDTEYMFVCGGDLNLHIKEYGDRTGKVDRLSEMLIDTIEDSDMRCLNNVYDRDHCTYPSSNAHLDLVFSCRKARIRDMKVGVAMIGDGPLMSDHLPITVTF